MFTLGIVGMAVAASLTIAVTGPGSGLPPLGVALMWLIILVAHGMAGFLLGKRLPLVVATPLALILSFVLTAYPAALEPLWLRHMVTGGASSCCALDQSLDWRAAASATVLALGIIAAAALALTALRRRTRTVAATGLLVAGLLGSGGLAYGLPADPATARSADELQCAGSDPRVCLWPELATHAEMIRQNASEARKRLQRAGIVVPRELTMQDRPGPQALFIGAWPQPTPSVVRTGVGTALLPAEPPTCAQNGDPFPGETAFGPVASWLALTAGADKEETAARYGEGETAVAQRVMRASAAQQLTWFRHNNQALRNCTSKPSAVPPASTTRSAKASR
ncbi:hypothetical protein [Streptomyces sp. ISL-100]|uniref:DUF7224 domain-containing protein n=1 Tax=Streptomyces sp. ISL-100 TaxID=2819173 RepID=UPI001BEC0850|nr:hypothetical protein [Streptomyces sp. ISL-100]MBT2401639.1 hypothetical protein [Streptomyces sp. ISL-100]